MDLRRELLLVSESSKTLAAIDQQVTRLGWSISGWARRIEGGVGVAWQAPADLLLLDLDMVHPDGLCTLAMLQSRFPRGRVIVLSDMAADIYAHRCMRLGAVAYLPKMMDDDLLRSALDQILRGHKIFPIVQGGGNMELNVLSDRELLAVRGIIRGYEEETVANNLQISRGNVRRLYLRLTGRFGLSMEGLAVWGREMSLR